MRPKLNFVAKIVSFHTETVHHAGKLVRVNGKKDGGDPKVVVFSYEFHRLLVEKHGATFVELLSYSVSDEYIPLCASGRWRGRVDVLCL